MQKTLKKLLTGALALSLTLVSTNIINAHDEYVAISENDIVNVENKEDSNFSYAIYKDTLPKDSEVTSVDYKYGTSFSEIKEDSKSVILNLNKDYTNDNDATIDLNIGNQNYIWFGLNGYTYTGNLNIDAGGMIENCRYDVELREYDDYNELHSVSRAREGSNTIGKIIGNIYCSDVEDSYCHNPINMLNVSVEGNVSFDEDVTAYLTSSTINGNMIIGDNKEVLFNTLQFNNNPGTGFLYLYDFTLNGTLQLGKNDKLYISDDELNNLNVVLPEGYELVKYSIDENDERDFKVDHYYLVSGSETEENTTVETNINEKLTALENSNNEALAKVLGEDSKLDVELNKVEEVDGTTHYIFEVTPYKANTVQHQLSTNITFKLPVVETDYKYANVYHEDNYIGQVEVKDNTIEVTSDSFSKYSYVLTNTVAENSSDNKEESTTTNSTESTTNEEYIITVNTCVK